MKANKFVVMGIVFLVSFSLVYATNHVVISEVLYDPFSESKEWVELYNPTNSSINIGGWKIYTNSVSTPDVTIPDGEIIQAFGYYLIADPNFNETIADHYEAMQLVNSDAGLVLEDSNNNSVDMLGWGNPLFSMTQYFETTPHSSVEEGNSLERKPGYLIPNCGNWQDTNNNSNDFLDNPNPEPQNSQNKTEEPCEEECTTDGDCDDNLYCNGQEECVDSFCQSGIAIDCDDNITCTDDSCNEATDSCDNLANDANCDDSLYCNGQEICDAVNDCQAGTPIDCSANDLAAIAICDNEPDNNAFTWDYFAGFISECDEAVDECTTGTVNLTHTCDKACGAECETDGGCSEKPNGICLETCVCEYGLYCGNGVVGLDEECDDGNLVNGDGCSSNCKIETELYLAPYVGDIDGNVDTDWFFFFDQLRRWHDENNISVGFSFYPTTIQNNAQFNQIIADMYFSKNIELIHKGESEGEKGLHNMSYEEVKALLESEQNHFISRMREILGINYIKLPVAYNQLYGKFTNTIRDVIHELGFKIYFEQYVSEYGYIDALPDLDIMQYSVSFTTSGQAGPSEAFKQPDDIFREILGFEHDHMIYINGTKVVSLLSHQQDFLISETSPIINQTKWDIYTGVLLMAKNDTRIHLLKPEEIYDLRHPYIPICGNGILEDGEECDDGNLVDGDGCSSLCEEIAIVDDLQVNYLRGRIRIDGANAGAGTKYKVEVLSGYNFRNYYEGGVDDENIPLFLNGNGFFDTSDQIIFSTGDSFGITSEDCDGIYEGVFLNGGNGDFNEEGSLIEFNCVIPPVIHTVYHSPAEPTEIEEINIFANITDNIGLDQVLVNYTVDGGNVSLMGMDCNEMCSINLGIFGFPSVIEYKIRANDSYGNYIESDIYTIIINPADRDEDEYTSDVDCDDYNAETNPGATEICNGIDDDCDSVIDEGFTDTDNNGEADCVDIDDDNDGVLDVEDNCILDLNSGQEDNDLDGMGDVCDEDDDNDGVLDIEDNCVYDVNPDQLDGDNDGAGNLCDICPNDADNDIDNDGVCGDIDNCVEDSNAGQADNDLDGMGDVCDEDDDNDGINDDGDDYPFDPDRWLFGDVNGDDSVNILDLIIVRNAIGSEPGDPDWNEEADANNDGDINILDLIIIRNNFT